MPWCAAGPQAPVPPESSWALALLSALLLMLPPLAGATSNNGQRGLAIRGEERGGWDLRVAPAVPLVGAQATVRLEVANNSEKVEEALEIEIEAERRPGETPILVMLEKNQSIAPGRAKEFTAFWTPQRNGWHRLLATVRRAGETLAVGSLRVPVVARPVHIVWWADPYREMRWITAVANASDAEKTYWQARGVLALRWAAGVDGWSYGWKPEQFVENYVSAAEAGYDGIAIDELGAYPGSEQERQQIEPMGEVFAAVRKKTSPGYFIAVWHCGSLTSAMANACRHNVDLIMSEAYPNYVRGELGAHPFYPSLDHRLDAARREDLLNGWPSYSPAKFIIALGLTKHHGGVTPEEVEGIFRYIRRRAPESPGIAFFSGGDDIQPEVRRRADECAERYFLRPMLTLWPEDIQPERFETTGDHPLEVSVEVHNIGPMDSGAGQVRLYAKEVREGEWHDAGSQPVTPIPAWFCQGPADEIGEIELGRCRLGFRWMPPKPGIYRLAVQILPGPGDEVLEPWVESEATIRVRP